MIFFPCPISLGKLENKAEWTVKSSSLGNFDGETREKAIDGIISTEEKTEFFHSDNNDLKPWFQVQLDQSYLVTQIDVYNREPFPTTDAHMDFEFLQVKTVVTTFKLIPVIPFYLSLQGRVGETDADGIFGSQLTINTDCGTSGVGPDDISLTCPNDTRGRFVTLKRTRYVFDVGRPFLVINEIDVIHSGV